MVKKVLSRSIETKIKKDEELVEEAENVIEEAKRFFFL